MERENGRDKKMNSVKKVDLPAAHWDRLFAPSSCLVMVTTVDEGGRINAASFGTCVRVCHDPVYIAFTVGATKDTYHNVLATDEFVVNVPSFEREILEKVRVVGLEFPPGVNELEKAGLTAIPSQVVKAPRIAECRSHFECRIEWTKQWLHRLMVVGKVVAASVDEGYVDEGGYIIWDKLKPAHYCGHEYKSKFVAAYQTMEVDMVYNESIGRRNQ
jgi:flavin reductase (DIM6/NTAB) family NADH-FMN oxidoreductase RutF